MDDKDRFIARKVLINITIVKFITKYDRSFWYNLSTDEILIESDAMIWIKDNKGSKNTNNHLIGYKEDVSSVINNAIILAKDPIEFIWISAYAIDKLEKLGYKALMKISKLDSKPIIISDAEGLELYNEKNNKEKIKEIKRKKGSWKNGDYDNIWIDLDKTFKIRGNSFIITKDSSSIIPKLGEAGKILKRFKKQLQQHEQEKINKYEYELVDQKEETCFCKSIPIQNPLFNYTYIINRTANELVYTKTIGAIKIINILKEEGRWMDSDDIILTSDFEQEKCLCNMNLVLFGPEAEEVIPITKITQELQEIKEETEKIPKEKEEMESEEHIGLNIKDLAKDEILIVPNYTKKNAAVILQDREQIEEVMKENDGRKFTFPESVGNSEGWLISNKLYDDVIEELKGTFSIKKKSRKKLEERAKKVRFDVPEISDVSEMSERSEFDEVVESIEVAPGLVSAGRLKNRSTCSVYQKIVNELKSIEQGRKAIHDELIKEKFAPPDGMLRKKHMKEKLLSNMLRLYDANFFDGVLINEFNKNGFEIQVSWNSSATKTAGFCKVPHKKSDKKICFISIEISMKVVYKTFEEDEKSHRASGLVCRDRLMCVQIVFEHELVHAIILGLCGLDESHGRTFKTYAKNAFGHTDYTHQLLGGEGEVLEKLEEDRKNRSAKIKRKLHVGDKVTIPVQPLKDAQTLQGVVKSVRGPKNFTAKGIRDPVPYWLVKTINSKEISGFEDILNPEIKMSKADKATIIRNKIRSVSKDGRGNEVKIKWIKDNRENSGTVRDSKGKKNATSNLITVNVFRGKFEFRLNYDKIISINDENIEFDDNENNNENNEDECLKFYNQAKFLPHGKFYAFVKFGEIIDEKKKYVTVEWNEYRVVDIVEIDKYNVKFVYEEDIEVDGEKWDKYFGIYEIDENQLATFIVVDYSNCKVKFSEEEILEKVKFKYPLEEKNYSPDYLD